MEQREKITFPQGEIRFGKNGKAYIRKNKAYENRFNNNLKKIQVYIDNQFVINLQDYVSYDTGAQALSIRLTTDCGSGRVRISVPYAFYQAYSKRIRKRVGLRGTQPFERMVADRGNMILRRIINESRRLNG